MVWSASGVFILAVELFVSCGFPHSGILERLSCVHVAAYKYGFDILEIEHGIVRQLGRYHRDVAQGHVLFLVCFGHEVVGAHRHIDEAVVALWCGQRAHVDTYKPAAHRPDNPRRMVAQHATVDVMGSVDFHRPEDNGYGT